MYSFAALARAEASCRRSSVRTASRCPKNMTLIEVMSHDCHDFLLVGSKHLGCFTGLVVFGSKST